MFKTKSKLINCMQSSAKPFLKDKNGNVAMIFAISAVPVLMATGLGIDYSRASNAKTAMQSVVDATVLAAVLDTTSTSCATKQVIAAQKINSEMSHKKFINAITNIVMTDILGGCTLSFSSSVDTAIMAIAGYTTMPISVKASAVANSGKNLEIALALDNTGSMSNQGMIDLKTAAKQFITIMNPDPLTGKVKIGLVPFVAVVNPGKAFIDSADMSDYAGDARYHGYYFANQVTTIAHDCIPNNGYSSGANPGTGGYGFLDDGLNKFSSKFAYATKELLGISTAHAQFVQPAGGTTTPTDFLTISTTWQNHNFTSPNLVTGLPSGNVMLPVGTSNHDFYFDNNSCFIYNPARVNYFDMFARTGAGGVPWKGCVMARNEPYDMDDSAPTSDPNTKFVPFFYPSEPPRFTVQSNGHYGFYPTWTQSDINDPKNDYKNNYMPYGVTPTGIYGSLSLGEVYEWANFYYVNPSFSISDMLKYNGTNNGFTIPINETGPDTIGPNKACPNEVTPLTSDANLLKSSIDALSDWNGGGTITSEGLMWAWRVLSPNLPYAMGAPYTSTTVQKYIILMTDGVNNVNTAGPPILQPAGEPATSIYSEETAYGAIIAGRTFAPQYGRDSTGQYPYPITDFPTANLFLDDRFAQACSNAKAQGIKVYTIYFQHTSYGTPDDSTAAANAQSNLQACSGSNFYYANSASDLTNAFTAIAKSILTGVRLTQ